MNPVCIEERFYHRLAGEYLNYEQRIVPSRELDKHPGTGISRIQEEWHHPWLLHTTDYAIKMHNNILHLLKSPTPPLHPNIRKHIICTLYISNNAHHSNFFDKKELTGNLKLATISSMLMIILLDSARIL